MLIIIDQWCSSIGLLYGQVCGHFSIKLSRVAVISKWLLLYYALFAFLLVLKHRDIETNPGPKKKETRFFSCLHWNINSILAHNKLTLLQAYNTIHQYDILCISETYLDSSISNDDTTLSLPGYNLARSDHPGNVKRGGVCILNRTLINVFSIFIPNKLVTFNDKDPLWMISDLRDKINWKNSIYKDYLKNCKTNYHYIKLQYAISEVSAAIFKGKDEYHQQLAQKLSDPSTSSKSYWSVLKIFYNGKRVPIIPPLLINKKLESDFKTF